MKNTQLLLINDMCGYGKVALSAMLPVLSHMGYRIHNLPTALVSDTLNYPKFYIHDTTEYVRQSLAIWEELGFEFDAISTGFIVTEEETRIISDFCHRRAQKGTKVFVDPIMGDNGKLYAGVPESTIGLMRHLLECADYAVPNYTEACLLADTPIAEQITPDEARALVDAVRELGADASFNGRNDLLIDGRKFSGNAQYRLGDCIVHHGSLLYDTNIEQMVASTTVDPYKILSKSIKSVRDRVTNISEHLPRELSVEEFKSCMVRHLMRGSTDTYAVTPEDDARIRQLAQEKFSAWDAIYGKNPRFNLERTGRFPGGKLTFRLDVQRGVIRSASVWGDFFSTLSAETIAGALTGCRYDRAAVLDALRKNGIDGAVYQISAADMAALIAD